MELPEILSKDLKFRYMLLDRMRMDCDYYLGNGRLYGNHLWAKDDESNLAGVSCGCKTSMADL